MKAMLITRCGCSRLLDIDLAPYQDILNIPMSPPNVMPQLAASTLEGLEDVRVDTVVRKFKMLDINDYFYTKGGGRILLYRETM